ncbi:MAG: hypothetical protein IJV03_00365 [Alphaproteobacteria bacterium]|jgi:hypothetical protein|nr:hypothetical protein [Alphaproteobacteria bacterium]
MQIFFCNMAKCYVAPNQYNGMAYCQNACANSYAQNQNICNQCVLCVRDAIVHGR